MRGWKGILDLSSNAWHGIGDTSTDVNDKILCFVLHCFVFVVEID
jgi:hypothetical protein